MIRETTRRCRRRQWASWALVVLAGCVTESYERPPLIKATTPSELFRSDAPLASDHSIAELPWQALFPDPVLRALIAEGLHKNLDLKIALARIEVAEANLAQSSAAFLPTLQVDATYSRSKQLPNNVARVPTTSLAQISASASWEADIWGKLRSQRRASQAQLDQSWALRHAVQTQLIADIATAYYSLLALDRQLALTQEALRIRIEDVATVQALKEGAVVTGADVVQSQANRYAAEVTIPDIKRDIRDRENALAILLARVPSPIQRSSLEQQTPLAQLATGVPAQLLANRPDVQAAEHAFRSAFELTNVARTYFYPSLPLSGSAGTASTTLDGLFSAGSFIGNITGGLLQPILNRGVNNQRLRVARAQQKEALYDFQSALLRAGEEVSNSLFAFQMAGEKAEARQHQIEALTQAVEFTKALLRYTSNTNYVDVLTAEQSLLNAQINAVNDRLQQLTAAVSLYRALGGGWREAPAR